MLANTPVSDRATKVAKLANAAMTSCKLTAAAAACCERLGNKVLKLPRGSQAQQKAHAAYEAATAHWQVAQDDGGGSIAVAHEAVAAASEARAAAEAAGAVDAESEGEEVWVGC